MRIVSVIIAVLLANFPSVARAEVLMVIGQHTLQSLSWCSDDKIYSLQSKDAPGSIAKSFEGKGALLVFRTCTDVDGNTHYFAREPRPNRNGVCRTYEHELFPGSDRDKAFVTLLYDGKASDWYFMMKGWKSWPPQNWLALHYTPENTVLAFVSDENCPRGDDPRYVKVKYVTDGTLKAFDNFWKRITSSPDEFTGAFKAIPPDQIGSVERLYSAVLDRHRQIWSIACEDSGCSAFVERFEVKFDTSDRGFEIKGLSELEETGY